MQLELAGEYLVMAATLAEIKSRMLLPRAADPNAEEEERSARRASCAGCRSTSASRGAAENIDAHPAHRARHLHGSAELASRRVARPCRSSRHMLKEMLLAFRDVVAALQDVRAPSRAARAAVGARAHVRYSRDAPSDVELRRVREPVQTAKRVAWVSRSLSSPSSSWCARG